MLQVADEEEAQTLSAFRAEVRDLRKEVDKLEAALKKGSRETIDELVHSLMYRADRARRNLLHPEPLDERSLARMLFHTTELHANCEALAAQTTIAGASRAVEAVHKTLDHLHQHAERVKFRRWHPVAKPDEHEHASESLPTTLVLGVTVDSAVDGLLVGLAFTASTSAGWCMSIATCIEMCFLGLSFSASIQYVTRSMVKHAAVVAVPPLTLALFGILGHSVGSTLEGSPGVFVGFISFSIVALLFLVTQELLAEARESGGDDAIVNIMIFVGLLSGILLEKVLG